MATNRRQFIKNTALAAGAVTLVGSSMANASILGSNKTVNLGMIGLHGRAKSLTTSLKNLSNVRLTHICDVDRKILEEHAKYTEKELGYKAELVDDFRKILDNKDIDGIVIATPEHWHAVMAIMGMQAGKHVYVEKPCSHNPHETELLIEVQKKTGKVCQMGNQQRSAKSSIIGIQKIRDGVIGEVYMGKAWYANARKTIGRGKVIAPPSHLNWDLWQGPAPREEYRDNVHPYNWHWFRTWGTGEIHNNATHEVDICRWALGVKYPNRAVSTGGRLHGKGDDWQWFDTQMASYEFDGGKTITWEGKSCNAQKPYGQGRGSMIFGTEGSMMLTRGGIRIYDLKGNEVEHLSEADAGTSQNTDDTKGFDGLTPRHLQNFINAIIEGETLRSPIDDAAISTQICHYGNIAQDTGESIRIDSETGRALDKKIIKEFWKREYEKGWEPKA